MEHCVALRGALCETLLDKTRQHLDMCNYTLYYKPYYPCEDLCAHVEALQVALAQLQQLRGAVLLHRQVAQQLDQQVRLPAATLPQAVRAPAHRPEPLQLTAQSGILRTAPPPRCSAPRGMR